MLTEQKKRHRSDTRLIGEAIDQGDVLANLGQSQCALALLELSNLVTENRRPSKLAVVRRVVLALVLWSVLPVQAAVPIRLKVIPNQGNKQAKPDLPVLLPPPPIINEQV